MKRATPQTSLSGARLVAIVDDYLARQRDGQAPDREQLLAQHPDLQDDLRACLDCLEFIGQAVAHERPISPDDLTVDPPINPTTTAPLGDYRLLQEIGRGGMGVIYEAEQLSLGRRVALKVLPFAAMLDERQLRRFKNEAHAAAVLHHPHIVPVFGVGCERGVHFYVMQLIEGHSLAELIDTPAPASATADTSPIAAISTAGSATKSGRARTVAELGVQAAEALDYAHREGVIHRDIKPSNLLVDRMGKLWVTDFGLARVQSANELTLTGDIVGTLRYMSPEQLAGDNVVDQRTDVYSLGLTLYELLLRQPAYTEENRERLMQRILNEDPESPRRVDATIPLDLETIILRAIEKDRNARYQSARELADDLRRFLDHQPVRARRTTRLQKLRYWVRRNPGIALLTTTVFALLMVFAVAATANSMRLARIAEDQSARLYAAEINRAKEAIDRGDLTLARSIVQRYSAPAQGKDPRGFEWSYLNDICQLSNTPRQLQHDYRCGNVAYSPDGRRIATCELTGRARVWDARTLDLVWQTEEGDLPVLSVAYRRDGTQLVAGCLDGTIRVWDAETGREQHQYLAEESDFFAVAVSPATGVIAAGKGPQYAGLREKAPHETANEVIIWNPDSDRVIRRFSMPGCILKLAFSPDGSVLAAGLYDASVRLWSTSDWRELPPLAGHNSAVFALAFSDDGKFLATGGGVWSDRFVLGEVKVWNTADWSLARSYSEHSNTVTALVFLPNNTLLSGSMDGTLAVWNLHDSRNAPVKMMLGCGLGVSALAVSPLGDEIASGGNDYIVRLWSAKDWLDSRSNPVRWHGRGEMLGDLAFAERGARICISDLRGKVIVRDVGSREVVYESQGTTAGVQALAVNEHAGLLAISDQFAIRVHNLATGEFVWSWKPPSPEGWGRRHDFSPSGSELAAGAGDTVYFLDARTGKPLRQFGPVGSMPVGAWAVRYSPNGRYVALARGNTYLLDLQSNRVVAEYDTAPKTWALEFSPSGDHLATAGRDSAIRIWDLQSHRLVASYLGHTGAVYSLDYSSDGRRLLSSGNDGTVRIWDTTSCQCVMTLSEHDGFVPTTCFLPDEQAIVSCGEDGSIVFCHAEATKPSVSPSTPLNAEKTSAVSFD